MWTLLIGNKNYSSWSLRAWLALRGLDIPFSEELMLLNGPGWKQALQERSPTGNVPVLIDGDLVIPETLAIIEYAAECCPDKPVWPEDRRARALARAAAAEMHAGFLALRRAAPMNLRAHHPGRVDIDGVAEDLRRLDRLLGDFLQRSGGPFLCGTFGAVDAMFAPVATRLRTYQLPATDLVETYVETIYAMPDFQDWLAAARHEPWIIEQDEIEFIQGKSA